MSNLFNQLSPKDATWRTTVDSFARYRIQRFILHPDRWASCPKTLPKLEWKKIRFDKANVKTLPDDKYGIYSFIAEPNVAHHTAVGYLLYIGKAQDQSLKKRVTSYLYEDQKEKPRIHIAEMLGHCPTYLWLHYTEIADQSSITTVEDALLEAFLPPFNKDFPATVSRLIQAVFK